MSELIGYLSEVEQLNGELTIPKQLGGSTLGSKTITANGVYDATDDGVDGYDVVTANVPNTYTASDEGKVVDNGALVSQTSATYTLNNTYDTTLINSVTVNVSGGSTPTLETVTKTYTPTTSQQTETITPSSGYDGIGEVDVTVNAIPSQYIIPTGTKSISSNGSGIDVTNYESVNVNVPNSYSQSDEGKVVSSGALVAQTAHADVTPTTSDQTIDTTLNNSLKVKGDADLVAANIKKDVEIFGVTGSYEGGGGGGIDINAIAMGTEPSGDMVLNTATNIKDRKFKECNNLTSVTAPLVTTLREQIFSNCVNLESISFAGATGVSSTQQFISCSKLTSVNLPNITSLGGNMFQSCSKLEIIDLPKVTTLNAARCFYGCNKLQTVILRYTGGVCPLNNEAFTNTPFAGYNGLTGTLYVPSALVASYKTASNWLTLFNNGTMSIVAIEGSQYE